MFHLHGRVQAVWFTEDPPLATVVEHVRSGDQPFGRSGRNATRVSFVPLDGRSAPVAVVIPAALKCSRPARGLVWCKDRKDAVYALSTATRAVAVDDDTLAQRGVHLEDLMDHAPIVDDDTGAAYYATTGGTSWRVDGTGRAEQVRTSAVRVTRAPPRFDRDSLEMPGGELVEPGHEARARLLRGPGGEEKPYGDEEYIHAKVVGDAASSAQLTADDGAIAFFRHDDKMDRKGHASQQAVAGVRTADGARLWDVVLAPDLPGAALAAAHLEGDSLILVVAREAAGAGVLAVDVHAGNVLWRRML